MPAPDVTSAPRHIGKQPVFVPSANTGPLEAPKKQMIRLFFFKMDTCVTEKSN